MKKFQKKLGNKGFSLVELIVVIAIMAVLVGVLAPTLIGNVEKSRESTDLQNLDSLKGAVVTALANDTVSNKVSNGATFTINGTKLEAVGSESEGAKKDLEKALEESIPAGIKMKSAAAMVTDAKVYISISSTGVVEVYVATKVGSANALPCNKTTSTDEGFKNEVGKRLYISK